MNSLYGKSINTKGKKTMNVVPIKYCWDCDVAKTESNVKIIC